MWEGMRAKILEIQEDNTEVKLRYIDSGVDDRTPAKHVHSLPERFQIIKHFAFWCRLRWIFCSQNDCIISVYNNLINIKLSYCLSYYTIHVII